MKLPITSTLRRPTLFGSPPCFIDFCIHHMIYFGKVLSPIAKGIEGNYDNGHCIEKLEVETVPLNLTYLLGLQQEIEDDTHLKCGHQYRHVSLLNRYQACFHLNSTKSKKMILTKLKTSTLIKSITLKKICTANVYLNIKKSTHFSLDEYSSCHSQMFEYFFCILFP